MIKLVLAAGLTLSIIGGFMSLRSNIGGLFGGSSRDASPLSGIKSLLGLPGGTSANSGSGGYLPPSDSSGSRYLPPASPTNRLRLQQDDSDADPTPAVFRIVLLSTTSTTASPSSSSSSTETTPTTADNVTSSDSEVVTLNATTPSYVTSSAAPIPEEDPTTKATTLPATPIVSPEVPRADFAGAGAGDGDVPSTTTAEIIAKPYTTLQPPTSFVPSIASSTSDPVVDSAAEKNISRPGYVLRPPPSLSEGLYLPPNL